MLSPEKLFLPDPEECYRIIRQTHWPEGVTCPYCGSKEVQKNGHTKRIQKYHCKTCGKLGTLVVQAAGWKFDCERTEGFY